MSVQLKAILAVLIVLPVALISCSATGKKVKKTKTAPLTPYQLRYATIDIPEGVTVIPDLSYEINDKDKHVYINAGIEEYAHDDIRPYFDKEIAELRKYNQVVEIVKQEKENIGGNKAFILRIEYKKYLESVLLEFVEYVGILCEKRHIVFKAWGFLKRFIPGEQLWQSMYRSFRSDKSQPYKLPFGSFILPKEGVDYSYILLRFPNEDDYTMEISYISNDRAQEIIREYKPNILGVFLRAKIVILKDKIVTVGGRKGRYFESRVIINGQIVPDALFHIPDGDKTVLQIEIGSNEVKTFERYRPQMEAMIQSIKFDESAAGAQE